MDDKGMKDRYVFDFDWPGLGITQTRWSGKGERTAFGSKDPPEPRYVPVVKFPRQHYKLIITFNWLERFICKLLGFDLSR